MCVHLTSSSKSRSLTSFLFRQGVYDTRHLPRLGLTPRAPQINQTGDLSNLSGLPASELALLPTLLELRDALYSKEFRSFVQEVTGCGPLSGIKTDMSCAEYSEGCYLLNHDDVIGTRRISFILYLVLDEPAWQPEVRSPSTESKRLLSLVSQWGGALELYPVLEADEQNPDRPNVPVSKPSVVIPVSSSVHFSLDED